MTPFFQVVLYMILGYLLIRACVVVYTVLRFLKEEYEKNERHYWDTLGKTFRDLGFPERELQQSAKRYAWERMKWGGF